MSVKNWRSMNEQDLTKLARKLGALEQESWAHSQIQRGIEHLPRDLFVLLAVGDVIYPDNRHWLAETRSRNPYDPGGEFGPAIDRLLAAGARVEDLTSIVATMQMSLLVNLCVLLDDPGELEPEVCDVRWRLFLVEESNAPDTPIDRLVEALWEIVWTGAESRPLQPIWTESFQAKGTGAWRSMNEQELTELFRQLGAQEPEGWARSQISEGIPQLLRYLFLRQAWRQIIAPDDRDWIIETHEDDPDQRDEFGEAIEAMLAAGAPAQDLTTVVRIMQWILLFRFCVLLDGGLAFRTGAGFSTLQELVGFCWRLSLVDDNDTPVAPIEGLHESVLETDPTGREMRPQEYFRNLDTRDPPG